MLCHIAKGTSISHVDREGGVGITKKTTKPKFGAIIHEWQRTFGGRALQKSYWLGVGGWLKKFYTLIHKEEGSKNWYTWLLDASEEHNSNYCPYFM